LLINRDNSLLLLVDLQEKLLAAMPDSEAVTHKASILLQAAKQVGAPILASEQYPRGLGPTVQPIAVQLDAAARMEKVEFSVFQNSALAGAIQHNNRKQIIISGVEAHVCVLQTALNAIELGYSAYVVADAISSRNPADKALALERLRANNIEIVSAEMVAFEWVGAASSPNFKAISNLVK
jgi:nicotinamidase-related amidase